MDERERSPDAGSVRLETVLRAFGMALTTEPDHNSALALIVELVRDEAITTEADEILVRHLPRLATGSQIGYFLLSWVRSSLDRSDLS